MSQTEDWNPGTCARFRGLRLRPALDLLAQVTAWDTQYVQRPEAGPIHPVRAITGSPAMRPFLDALTADAAAAFTAANDAALGSAYPLLPDGGVLHPFRRVCLVAERA